MRRHEEGHVFTRCCASASLSALLWSSVKVRDPYFASIAAIAWPDSTARLTVRIPPTDATTTMSADQPSLARLLIDCLSTNSFAIVFRTASATAATHSQNTDPPTWTISRSRPAVHSHRLPPGAQHDAAVLYALATA